MLTLGPLGFAAPGLLLALVALPLLWWLLRAVPPAPVVRRFPGVSLLLGLRDTTQEADKTPWWLLLLRALAVAALIVAFAGPVLNPQVDRTGSGPLLVVTDATWASARDWPRRQDRMAEVLDEAGRAGRTVAVVALTAPPQGGVVFRAADAAVENLPSVTPQPWEPVPDTAWLDTLPEAVETYWLSDGLARPSRDTLLAALEQRGPVAVFETTRPVVALPPVTYADGLLTVTARRLSDAVATDMVVSAMGRDPAGVERELARVTLEFSAGDTAASAELSLQPELRNRITRFQIAGERGAGAVSLTDDALQRRKVAMLSGRDGREGLELLSPLYFLRQALDPVADLIESPSLDDLLLSAPDVIVLADHALISEVETAQVQAWIDGGGMLLRFAGPRLAASDLSRDSEDPLMPVRLRIGGRTVGGAMSWGEPRTLRPFAEDGPFAGLTIPDDVTVASQVMAQPDPGLADRTIASLADGTPLVTRKYLGDGQVVLFHVTANAEWSTLPLSGLFVDMLERLAVSTRPAAPGAEDLVGTSWVPERVLDGFGVVQDAGNMVAVQGEALSGGVSADVPPGVYAGPAGRFALNVTTPETRLQSTAWPADIPLERGSVTRETDLKGVVLMLALGALFIDILATLGLSGGGASRRFGRASAVAVALMLALSMPQGAQAEIDDRLALQATDAVALAHIVTGDPRVDDVAQAGLAGLSQTLFRRTSVEPVDPIGVDLERDELTFFPFLYWPVTESTPIPSDAAYAKLNRYLRGGGMIMFDTRDAELARLSRTTPAARRLQALARPLDIPPLEPIPEDHVLTRTFYLLQDFPGRFTGADVWVEAAPADATQVDGTPFRNLNDGVTPVIIGAHDWAAAWAVDERGAPLLPVGRGLAGERQREIALRFGVNLIMHVLTGNYKSDQVHVPALLERLGQ
ncbi:DUF4159 domain-containing protein [Roseicitreum antarcticum]|uniref:N-terminal double-transmembrane domain-containing protein n=1 Tax=Roseicitreum antarcticum TaxID=564137 RepID=A0A1H3B045_9RHOB|nr:DUF4159 domain-containing protein [Roseicitreum antarcticum]SDX35322.1 N-terminal double-transmembrane domain-containing protein [Roseicitreum antarcticum]